MRSDGLLALNALQKFLIAIVGGTHPFVPKSEKEAVISVWVLMMKIVIGRGIQPTPPSALREPAGKELKAEMAAHIKKARPKKEDQQCRRMNGYEQDQEHEKTCLHYGLERMKRECGPRRGII